MKPQDWMAHMERKRINLEMMAMTLPQGEYQASILTLKAKLRYDD